MKRGTVVGDRVSVRPRRRLVLHGTITAIDSQGVRCVATAHGHVWAVPDEMHDSDEPDHVKAIEDVRPGDTIVTFNGHRRLVENVALVGLGAAQHYRLRYADLPPYPREQTASPGERWYVL